MVQHLAYATALIFGTTLIHFTCTVGVIRWTRSIEGHRWVLRSATAKASVLSGLILVMSLAAFFESALWGGFYLWVGALANTEEALYFSLVTFTTLGYGDINLGVDWRLLAAFEAANGIIMFGWTTAMIVAVATRLFALGPARAKRP